MDGLITALVLLIVSALATRFRKKAPGPDDSTPSAPPTPPGGQPRPARATSWEEELRRLLEGQPSAAPPPARPPPMQPPPPLVTSRPRQTPAAPPMVIKPVLVPPERRPGVSTPRPVPATPRPSPVPVRSAVEISAGQLAPLRQSKEAYERAAQLDKQMAAHIDRVPGQRVLATTVTRREASPEIVQAASMFKNGRAARQAVIASLILGPPRSLEEMTPVS